jgi:hypothetical protein
VPSSLAAAAIEYRAERARSESPAVPRYEARAPNGCDDAAPPMNQVGYSGREAPPRAPKFVLEPFESIKFESKEEWLVKRILPRQGFVSLFGASQSFKSFVVSDLAMHVALGWEWAGRRVEQSAAVYIAAEGAAGLRKRKVGFELTHAERLPEKVRFFLISASPNLGTERGDLADLIAAVESAEVAPGLIIIDTLAQSIGAGDENGAGMILFISNATALANHFKACVIAIHHIGLSDDKRTRGHSSLLGGVDAQILAERKEGTFSTTITLQKLKDEASNLKLTARLSRVVIGTDGDGEEVSTLIVERIEDGAEATTGTKPVSVPRGRRLIMDITAHALDEVGEDFRPYANGPIVRAVSDEAVRERYYDRIAEKAEPDEDAHKLAERQRKAFNRAIKDALNAKDLIAKEHGGARLLWLP